MAVANHRLEQSRRALATYRQALLAPLSNIENRDVAILRFVYSFATVWMAVIAFAGPDA